MSNVYLVGGAVRDELLGIESKDDDYVVVGQTEVNMKAMGFISVGADFPVFLHPETKEEYALARTERKTGKGYTGFTVDASESVTLEEDLARRDLTINSIAKSQNGELIDPFNGQADLINKTLRHTTEAFAEDPVRVLRIARFLARYGDEWSIHPDTYTLMEQIRDAGELDNLVPERVWKETEKALGEKQPELYFKTLDGFGLFPEVEGMHNIPQPEAHHPEGDVLVHTMLVLRRAADLNFDLLTRFAALTHDFGKAPNFAERGNLHGHEERGVEVIEQFCDRLKVPNKYRQLAVLMSDNHTRCHKINELIPKKLHKFVVTNMSALTHPERFEQFLNACQCDAQGRGETLVNRPYPQVDFARALVSNLSTFDKKASARKAIEQGKQGVQIKEAIRCDEIQHIRDWLASKGS